MRVSLEDLREGRLKANILLQDSDTIIVPPAERYYVSGYVKQPGSFVLRPGHDRATGDRRSRRRHRTRLRRAASRSFARSRARKSRSTPRCPTSSGRTTRSASASA